MKALLKIVLGIVVSVTMFKLMYKQGEQSTGQKVNAVYSSATPTPTVSVRSELEIKADQVRLIKLKKNFILKMDEFKNIGWYTHKNQHRSYYRNYLKANVNTNGYIYLEDQFYGETWVFHEQTIVKIGDLVLETETVPTHSPKNVTQNGSGKVWEMITYTSDMSSRIIETIASSNKNQQIKVRFRGSKYIKDFTLSSLDRVAIAESYELSKLLKSVGSLK